MTLLRLILPVGVLAASLSAQSAPCLAFNDASATVSSGITSSPFVGLNPNSRAYQFTTPNAIVALSASIFTGSPIHDDYMRLEIWDDDPSTAAPGNRLATGTFFSPMTTTAHWMGTNFDNGVVLNPGTNYWLVWVDSGGSVVPEEPGGVTLPRKTRNANRAWSTTAGAGAVKARLFCNQLDGATVTPIGAPARTSSNQLPTVFTNDDPAVGNASFGVEGTNLPPGANAWLLIGFDPNAATTPMGPMFPAGCTLYTDIVAAIGSATGVAEIGDQPTTPRPSPFGHVRFSLPLTSAASGVFFSAQLLGFDSGAAATIPIVFTNAIRVTIP